MAGNGGGKLPNIAVYRHLLSYIAIYPRRGTVNFNPPFPPFVTIGGFPATMKPDDRKEITILVGPRSGPYKFGNSVSDRNNFRHEVNPKNYRAKLQ